MTHTWNGRITCAAAALLALGGCFAQGLWSDENGKGETTLTQDELRAIQVQAAYRGILGREADPQGLDHHVALLRGGMQVVTLCSGLFASPEFATFRAQLTIEQLADELYRGILSRDADAGGRSHTIAEIVAGRRAQRAAAMIESQEFIDRFMGGQTPGGSATDNAAIAAVQLPTTMVCGASFAAKVTVSNTGTSVWTADVFKLGTVGDQDPLYDVTRVYMPTGTTVVPGGSFVFTFTLHAPAIPGTYTTDWQMVHEAVHWFGATTLSQVAVSCSGDPGGMPAPGVPVASGDLLRQQNARLLLLGTQQPFDAFMAVQCCMESPPEVGNSRWPLASESWMDFANSYGANMFHFRLGPFYGDANHESDWQDLGGAYLSPGGAFNPAFWDKVRQLVWHAHQIGAYVEVNPIDTWYCKHAQWGDQPMPWATADIEACGRYASPEQERFLRQTVRQLGCFSNVIWLDGNEADQVSGYSPNWTKWVRDVVRDEEATNGCGFVHLFGTNASGNSTAVNAVDYVATHEKAPLLGPIGGHWTINNERNPNFSPATEASYFAQARAAGQAWAFWRADMNDAEMRDTLSRFEQVVEGTQPECFIPEAEAPGWVLVGAAASVRPSQTLASVLEAESRVGDRTGYPPLETLALVAAELRAMGLCADGPWGDAVGVLAPDGYYEEMHCVAYTTGGYTSASRKFKNLWAYP